MIQTQRCVVHRFTTKCMGMKRMHDRVTFGHYRVLQRDDGSPWELGSGAMGVTYKALDTDLQCPVALKVINSDLMADEANRNRFLREARAAAGLRHSNVASVYHLAQDEEQFFYAMEFIDGETTEANVARFGPMALRPALRIAWQVSKALAAAAKQQLVHRDIKPANIMIVADPEEEDWPFVKLIDFGLVWSAMRGHDSAGETRSGFLGTAQFASPEQIEESEVDGRSDIYSLGCTLWYLLTGEAPFTGPLASVFAQHLGSEPPWEKLNAVSETNSWPAQAHVAERALAAPGQRGGVATGNRAMSRRGGKEGVSGSEDSSAPPYRPQMAYRGSAVSRRCDLRRFRDRPSARLRLQRERWLFPGVRARSAKERSRVERGFRRSERMVCEGRPRLVLSEQLG